MHTPAFVIKPNLTLAATVAHRNIDRLIIPCTQAFSSLINPKFSSKDYSTLAFRWFVLLVFSSISSNMLTHTKLLQPLAMHTTNPSSTLAKPSQALVANGVRLDLPSVISAAAELQRDPVPEGTNAAVADFVARRLEQLLVDGGCAVHGVRAVLGHRGRDPTLAATSARELQVNPRPQNLSVETKG